jgi:RNA polymerase sigma-70 factor (ECF subfamily)
MTAHAGRVASEADAESRRRFEELTLPHFEALFRFAVRLTGDTAAAEDLVQELYLKALKAFGELRDTGRVRPWLFQILNRLITDRHRSAGREVQTHSQDDLDRFSLYDMVWEEDPLPYSERLHEDFLARFRDEEVRAALLALPEMYRVPLVLVYTQETSYRELAGILDCPMGTVMSRLHRGRKILEKELWECAKRRGLVKTWKQRSD